MPAIAADEFRAALLGNETSANPRNSVTSFPFVVRLLVKLNVFGVLILLLSPFALRQRGGFQVANFQFSSQQYDSRLAPLDLATTLGNALSGSSTSHSGHENSGFKTQFPSPDGGMVGGKDMPYPVGPATKEVCEKRHGTYHDDLKQQYPWLKGRVCLCHQDSSWQNSSNLLLPELALYMSANVAFAYALNRGNPEVYPFAHTLVTIGNFATFLSLLVVWLSHDLLRLCFTWNELIGQIAPFCSFVMVLLWGTAKVSGPIPERVRVVNATPAGDNADATAPASDPPPTVPSENR